MDRERKEVNQGFVDDLKNSWTPISEALTARKAMLTDAVYKLLTEAFPSYEFKKEKIVLQKHCTPPHVSNYVEAAIYRDSYLSCFTVTTTGNVSRNLTDFAESSQKALFQAEGQSEICLVLSKEDRECEIRVFSKYDGRRAKEYGWKTTRLTHTDTYGFEYIIVGDEKMFLEPLKKQVVV